MNKNETRKLKLAGLIFFGQKLANRTIEKMAVATGRDSIDLRRELSKDDQRAKGVIGLAAEKSNWDDPLPAGQGRGVACFATFGVMYIADVAE